MTKKQKQSPLAVAIDSDKSDGNTNSNKEVTMSDATSGTVTMTVTELNERLAAAAQSGKKDAKAKTCTKKWICIMSRKDIRESSAPPQMQIIMNAVRLEVELCPDKEWHESDVIIDRLVDEDGSTMMTFSKTYRGAEETVLRKRIVEIMNYYAHPDMIEKYALDRDTYDCK
jgi:hypothetical protein